MINHALIIVIDIVLAGPVGRLHVRTAKNNRSTGAPGIGADSGIVQELLLAGNLLLAAVGKSDTLCE